MGSSCGVLLTAPSPCPAHKADDNATIRVTNLSEDTRETDLQELFRPFGSISRIYLAKDKTTGQSKVGELGCGPGGWGVGTRGARLWLPVCPAPPTGLCLHQLSPPRGRRARHCGRVWLRLRPSYPQCRVGQVRTPSPFPHSLPSPVMWLPGLSEGRSFFSGKTLLGTTLLVLSRHGQVSWCVRAGSGTFRITSPHLHPYHLPPSFQAIYELIRHLLPAAVVQILRDRKLPVNRLQMHCVLVFMGLPVVGWGA